jgi:aminopeptidase N
MDSKLLTCALSLIILASCQPTNKQEQPMKISDPHSYSKPDVASVTHLNWSAEVNFDKRQIQATAEWDIKRSPNCSEIIFDTKSLTIGAVAVDGEETDFTLTETDPILGSALTIPINPESKKVLIRYTTDSSAEALQWLSPQQTSGKTYPFLFTQSQAILARSWVPTQDSPGIRFTYSADIRVPKELIALMSATNPQTKNDSGEYHFEMKQPIPSYLLALAVGDIVFQSISERSGVYAEPATIERAAYEFVDLEK